MIVFAAVQESAFGTSRAYRHVRPTSAIEGNSDAICSSESFTASACDSKDLGVAKIAHSTTLARRVLPEGFSGMAWINFLRVQNPNPAETSRF
jgi:hypothetical protein